SGVDVTITPVNDVAVEGTETVTLSLAAGAYGRGPAATLYLSDNEVPSIAVDFNASGGTAIESAGTVNIPVTLSAASGSGASVEYVVETATRQSVSVNGTPISPLPYWVRVDRAGDTVIGSISPDGTNWTGVSTQVFTMPTSGYLAGLYVCSFNSGLLSTGVFDNVTITNLQPGATIGVRSAGNVGSVSVTGSATVLGNTHTVAGAGDNVEGTTDQGYFTWWPITNSTSCTIIARIVLQHNTAVGATAGVMIRESSVNNVRRGYMAATPGVGFEYHYRNVAIGQDARVTAFGAKPAWVRLQRSGDVIRSFQSSDGVLWNQVGADVPLPFGPEVLAGLAVSSQLEGGLATATFDNVTVTPGALPSLGGRTVGFTAIQGTHAESAGVYTISSSGEGINGSNDDCYFLSGYITGDFTITARVTSLASTNSSPQAGVMIRENTRRPARMAFIGSVPAGTPQMISRNSTLTIANGVGIDYSLESGVLTFAAGATTRNIPISLINDSIPEQDEVVMVLLRNANGARLGSRGQYAFVIVDDDAAPAEPFVGFAAASTSASEASGTVQVPVTLSVAATAAGSVDYQLIPGSATAPGDFFASSGTLNFAPGDTVRSIAVNLVNDGSTEATETFQVRLSNPVGLRFTTITNHTITLLDDDLPLVTISSTDTNATEAGDTSLVTLTRSGSISGPLTVNLSRTGTATADADYIGINSTAVFGIGESSITLTLAPAQDATSEATETAITAIAAGSGYVAGAPSSITSFIADDDRNSVSIIADGGTAKEGSTNGSFTITRAGSTAVSLAVNLALTGTATTGSDYTNTPTSLTSITFAIGQSARTVTIHPLDDLVTEGDEMVLLQIMTGAYDISGIAYASVTITDNDIPPTVFISSPAAQGVVVALSNGVEFVATAIDEDAFPEPVSYAWTQVAGPGTVAFGASNSVATPATFSAMGTYIVRVTVSDGRFTASDQITINVGATNALVANDWIAEDVGPPTLRGFAGRSGSNWIVSAAGVGYGTTSDRAHAVVRQVTGDGTIIARVTSINGPAASEAGVSVRDAMHRYSRRAALVYQSSSRTVRFRPRLASNTTDFSVSVANLDLPLWLKLERNSVTGTVAAFYATNNSGIPGPWLQVSTNVNITMDATADYSFTADSGSDTVAAVATFDNISLTPAPGGPAVLFEDFGGGTQAGTYAYESGTDTHTVA
ncbi:MAG TPA: Calx-beta domain-containing protein, partial [Candidatus Acidoferrum sp.]|nr:Calx-beta domain-containing protein [Candidatus Acidoferrum sp.]